MSRFYTFHQFVVMERGPVKTAIIDLLKGDVWHVDNEQTDKFLNGDYDAIPDFVSSLLREELIFEASEEVWVPFLTFSGSEASAGGAVESLIIEVETGSDLWRIAGVFADIEISGVRFFGQESPENLEIVFPGASVTFHEKNMSPCLARSNLSSCLPQVNEKAYLAARNYNLCWSGKLAIDNQGNARPCIFSSIIIGNICDHISGRAFVEQAQFYWRLSINRVEKCNTCELRYVCPDCREIAARHTGNLYASNPSCRYNPQTGIREPL